MPLPPALFAALAGPKSVALAKAFAVDFLPALSSTSLAAILVKLAWKRVPAWIKEDVTFRGSGGDDKMNNNNYTNSHHSDDVERLSSVLEKIQAWMERVSEQQLQSPVPFHNATLMIYWQLMAQHQKQRRKRMANYCTNDNSAAPAAATTVVAAEATTLEAETTPAVHALEELVLFPSCDNHNMDDSVKFSVLQDMLTLATWAYYLNDEDDLRTKLETLQYDLKTSYVPSRPGSVGYFTAEREECSSSCTNHNNGTGRDDDETNVGGRKTLLIGVRGTSSLEELLTDACGQSVSFNGLEYGDDDIYNSVRIEVAAQKQDKVCYSQVSEFNASNEEIQVEIVSGHERIWVEQDMLLEEMASIDQRATETETTTSAKRKDFVSRRASMDSHIRCHEGILLSAKRLFVQVRPVIEELVINGNHRLLLVGHSLGASAACLLALMLRSRYPDLVNSDRLHVYSFAPPPVLDHDTAIGASSYVTSVVYGSDLIPRSSLANLAVFLELLFTISSDILVAKGLAPTGATSTAALLRQLFQGDQGEPFWSEEELALAVANARAKVEVRDPDHLYVPGKVYHLEPLDCSLLQDEEDPNMVVGRGYTCTLTDGTAPSLRIVEMNGHRMLGDHTTASYHAALVALTLAQQSEACTSRK